MPSITFRQTRSHTEGEWVQYDLVQRTDNGFSSQPIDLKIRAMLPHQGKALMEAFLEKVDPQNPTSAEHIPKERQREYKAAQVDHFLERLGGDDTPDHPHGLDLTRCRKCKNLDPEGYPDAPEYDIAHCHCHEPEFEDVPWPMTPKYKHFLVCLIPPLDGFIRRASDRLAAPYVADQQEAEVEHENLDGTQPS